MTSADIGLISITGTNSTDKQRTVLENGLRENRVKCTQLKEDNRYLKELVTNRNGSPASSVKRSLRYRNGFGIRCC